MAPCNFNEPMPEIYESNFTDILDKFQVDQY